jgi:hypothetical protein
MDMDTLTRQLMIEIAKTVLRVLDAQPAKVAQPVNPEAVPTPWATAVNREADKGTPKPAPAAKPEPAPAGLAQRGDTVQFWDGNRYSIGIVQNICRKKVGQPASIAVRVERGEGRKGKTHKIEQAKAKVLKGVVNG